MYVHEYWLIIFTWKNIECYYLLCYCINSYQHGAITHLCPHEDEEAVATNFKRGILSSLQMTVAPNCNQSDMIVSEVRTPSIYIIT